MADFARVSGEGWRQGDDSTDQSRVGSDGWWQVVSAGGGSANYTLAAGGSFALSGTVIPARGRAYDVSGAFALSGTAILARNRTLEASGGFSLSGTSGFVKNFQLTSGGVVTLSGDGGIITTSINPGVAASERLLRGAGV